MGRESAKGLFESLFGQLHEVASNLISMIYSAEQVIFFNGLAYSLIGLIAIFWLIKRLHKGGIDKEDAYQALIWIVIVSIIYVIMGNEGAYYEFLNLLDLPINYVSAITAQSFGNTDFATSFGNGIDTLNNGISAIYESLFKYFEGQGKGFLFDDPTFLTTIYTIIYMFFWGIMWLTYMILILAITSICIVTKFMATIILSIAPIVIPCLMMNQLRGYFFSWLKLYLSYSMYAPIAMIIGNFPMKALEKVELIPDNTSQLTQIIASFTFIFFKPISLMIVAIIAIMVLVKVPSWVNQILGTQNDDAVGLAPLKAVGSAITTGAMTGGAGLIAGAGIKASLGKGMASMLPMGQTATKLYDSFKKGGGISNGKTSAISDFFK
ncbi:hypothetical protein LS72_005080 [Helicobacter apodemus]|uniref:Type IV secretion system protein n=1 Tax=Helicobacter apodemus TaxID=135569 RepID=A0A4V6I6L5_9HELI|nr:type IV secretion system protein [Helicobacter apodemus]TLE15934.1 hypothetical protein LS72_005080 [Helicobacter apodemus]